MNLNELMDEIVGVIEEWNGDVTEEQIRAAIEAYAAEQVAAEREAIAVLIQRTDLTGVKHYGWLCCFSDLLNGLAAAIRARAQEE